MFSEMFIRNMQVNFQSYPLGVSPQKVFFSWVLQSKNRGGRQSAYRIIVSQIARAGEDITGHWRYMG